MSHLKKTWRTYVRARWRASCACVLGAAVAVACAAAAQGAASSTVVSATVPSATLLDTDDCLPYVPDVTDFGSVLPGSVVKTGSDCSVSFGSSNDSASLRLAQADGVGTAMAAPADEWTRYGGISRRYVAVDSFGSLAMIAATGGQVVRSNDGGATWDATVSTGGGNFRSIAVVSATTAWVGADGSSTVRRSTNANTAGTPSFPAVAVGPGINVRALDAISATHAWVVGANGAIRSTTNGGTGAWTTHTWTDQPGGPGAGADVLDGVEALDADSIVAWGPYGRIVATSDGTTWRDISLPSTVTVRGVAVLSDTTMVAVGDGGRIFTTGNATSPSPTWTSRSSGLDVNLHDAEFWNATDGFAVGDDGRITRTTNGGASWTPDDVGTSNALQGAARTGATTAILVGGGTTVVTTSDTGATWTQQPGELTAWQGLTLTTDGTGWRVGSDGAIEKSTTGGATWTAQVSGTSADLFEAYAFDTQRAVAVGRDGTIVRTQDGGSTWTTVASGVTADLESVRGVETGRAWAVGANGTVLRTTDFGATWALQHTSPGMVLHELAVVDATTAVAIGMAGASLRTGDGSTWVAAGIPSSAAGTAITVERRSGTIFAQLGWGMFRSTDGGVSWENRGQTGTAFRDLVALDELRVIGVTAGIIRATTNAGSSWSPMTGNEVTYHWLNAAEAFDDSRVVTVGDGNVSGAIVPTDPVADYQQGVSDWYDDGSEAFGVCLRTTTATATWTANATCDQAADGAHWRGVPTATDSGSEVARTGAGDGTRTASFRFGLRVDPAHPPGPIRAGLLFVVIAPATS